MQRRAKVKYWFISRYQYRPFLVPWKNKLDTPSISLPRGAWLHILSLKIKKSTQYINQFLLQNSCFPHLAVPLPLYLEYILRRGGILATLATLSLLKKVFPQK